MSGKAPRGWSNTWPDSLPTDVGALLNVRYSYFVVDTKGIVQLAHVDPDYMLGRVEPDTIIKILEQIKSGSAFSN